MMNKLEQIYEAQVRHNQQKLERYNEQQVQNAYTTWKYNHFLKKFQKMKIEKSYSNSGSSLTTPRYAESTITSMADSVRIERPGKFFRVPPLPSQEKIKKKLNYYFEILT